MTFHLYSHLDIFGLVFKVNPGMRVAPNEDCEEQGADDGGHQHDEQAKQSLSTGSVQGIIVESKSRICQPAFFKIFD